MSDLLHRPRRERAVEVAARAGLVSRGVLWLLVGALAVRLAVLRTTSGEEAPDKRGALQVVVRQPFGRALLAALLVGFVAMVVWSAIEAVQRRDGSRGGHWGHRAAAAGRVVVYVGVAASTAPAVLSGRGEEAGGEGGGGFAGEALGWTGGRLLVGAIGLALLAAAGWNGYRAATRRYERHWDQSKLRGGRRRVAGLVEPAGYVGHALAFALVGWFLLRAAWAYDAAQPTTLDGSLAAVVGRSYGQLLCGVVAVGVLAWGLCSLGQAAWRDVPEG